jgi:hypothetical protein
VSGTVHGASRPRTPEYNVWLHMRERCTNPNHVRYARYGGRGITIDPAWDSFAQFFADMGERPPGLTLDRVNKDGPYAAHNCKWSTDSEQNKNRIERATEHCGGRDGSPRCGYWANHAGFCQTPPELDLEDTSAWEAVG